MKTAHLTSRFHQARTMPLIRGRLAILMVGGLAAGLSLMAPEAATAAPRHHGVRIHAGYSYPHRPYRPYRRVVVAPAYRVAPYVAVRPGYFPVPRRIVVRGDVAYYRPYYRRGVYYRGHGHHHRVYRFPIYSKSRKKKYRTYSYCDGALYGGVHLVRGRPGVTVAVRR